MWYEKIKEGVRRVLKVHPASICVFLICCILGGIKADFGESIGKGMAENVLQFIFLLTGLVTPALVVCEANYAYKKKAGKIESLKEIKKSLVYIITIVIGTVISGIYAYIRSFMYTEYRKAGSDLRSFSDYFDRILYVYLAVCVLGALGFMYEKFGDSFEK